MIEQNNSLIPFAAGELFRDLEFDEASKFCRNI